MPVVAEPITLPVVKPITEVVTMEIESVEEVQEQYISVGDVCDSATMNVLCQQYDELV